MNPPLPDRIREAVASGEFQKALLLWNEYVGELQEEFQQHRLSAAHMKEMGALVEWCRGVVLCARAHDQDVLAVLSAAAKYAEPAPRNRPRLVQATL
jgi:hypothetical protein